MPFNITKSKILHVGTRNQKFDYDLCGTQIESVLSVKDLGVTVESNLKFSKQCKEAAAKANRMLGFIKRNFSFKSKDIVTSGAKRSEVLLRLTLGVSGPARPDPTRPDPTRPDPAVTLFTRRYLRNYKADLNRTFTIL